MLKRILPFVVAVLAMGVVMAVVFMARPEIRAELGKIRRTQPIEVEAPEA